MADAGAAGAAGEPSVGDQRHALSKSLAHDVRGRCEHFLHARSSAGAFVTDDDNVSRLDLAAENAVTCFFLRVEDDSLTLKGQHICGHTGFLHHRALFCEVSAQNG